MSAEMKPGFIVKNGVAFQQLLGMEYKQYISGLAPQKLNELLQR